MGEGEGSPTDNVKEHNGRSLCKSSFRVCYKKYLSLDSGLSSRKT